jgi:Tol biopolymer transport system component
MRRFPPHAMSREKTLLFLSTQKWRNEMTQDFGQVDEIQADEEMPASTSPRWRTYFLPSLALAVLAAAVIAGYALYSTSRNMPLLAAFHPARIAFMSNRDGNWEIYIMDRDGNNLQNLTNSPARDGLPIHEAGQNKLVFASDQGGDELDVFTMNLDGSDVTNVTAMSSSNEIPIAWSPDGKHVIFASDQSGATEIFMIDINGTGLLNLSERDKAQSFDDWEARADRFVLTAMSESGPALLVTNLAGDTHQALTDGSYPATGGNWSPDGQKISYMAIGPNSTAIDVYVIDAAGGEPTNLTQSPANDSFPRWSPDGSRIAFVSDRDGNSEIYVMDADGSNQINLTNNPANEAIQGDFAWSPDGTQILFHTDRDDNIEIYVMDADGGNQTNLTNSPETDYFAVWVK